MFANAIAGIFLGLSSLIFPFGYSGESSGVVPPDGWHYSIKGVYETADTEYRYGDAYPVGTEDADGLLIILDKESGEATVIQYPDTGYQEIFLFLGDFGDGTLVLVRDRIFLDEARIPRLRDVTLLRISLQGEILQEKTLPENMNDFHNVGGFLIVRKTRNSSEAQAYGPDLDETGMPVMPEEAQSGFSLEYIGEATVDGASVPGVFLTWPGVHDVVVTHGTFVYAFSILITPGISEPVDGGVYDDPFAIWCDGDLFLDGIPFLAGNFAEVPGNHVLAISGTGGCLWEIRFSLRPYLETISDGCRSEIPLRIFSNAESLLLDGNSVDNGELVGAPGWHELTLRGCNEYEETIRFAILPRVFGIEDGGVYPESALFTVLGIASLDGKEISEGIQEISTPGEHELILWLDSERIETLRFSIGEPSSDTPEGNQSGDSSWVETGLAILALAGLFLILKKK